MDGWIDQGQIGWECILEGGVAHSWGTHQGCIWLMGQSRKSCWQWTIELIKKLWNVGWDMWEHCNGALHDSPQEQQNIVESRVNDAISRAHYAHGPQALPRNAMYLLAQPINHQLALPLMAKQQ